LERGVLGDQKKWSGGGRGRPRLPGFCCQKGASPGGDEGKLPECRGWKQKRGGGKKKNDASLGAVD